MGLEFRLECRWVYKTKRDKHDQVVRCKARFVAQGFSQQPGLDFTDTYPPVSNFTFLRMTLALAAAGD